MSSLTEQAREFFKNWDNGDQIFPLHHALVETIMCFKPRRVFDFGAGNGKIMQLVLDRDPTIEISGCDLARPAVEKAKKAGLDVEVGTEDFFENMGGFSFDVIYTCSVLDHIPEIRDLMEEFHYVARNIVVAETLDRGPNPFYFPHDYESYGLKPTGYEWLEPGDGCTYKIWSSREG